MWASWSSWSACSSTCQGGIRQRTRTCRNGNTCPGASFENQNCNANVPCVTLRKCTKLTYYALNSSFGPHCHACDGTFASVFMLIQPVVGSGAPGASVLGTVEGEQESGLGNVGAMNVTVSRRAVTHKNATLRTCKVKMGGGV